MGGWPPACQGVVFLPNWFIIYSKATEKKAIFVEIYLGFVKNHGLHSLASIDGNPVHVVLQKTLVFKHIFRIFGLYWPAHGG